MGGGVTRTLGTPLSPTWFKWRQWEGMSGVSASTVAYWTEYTGTTILHLEIIVKFVCEKLEEQSKATTTKKWTTNDFPIQQWVYGRLFNRTTNFDRLTDSLNNMQHATSILVQQTTKEQSNATTTKKQTTNNLPIQQWVYDRLFNRTKQHKRKWGRKEDWEYLF